MDFRSYFGYGEDEDTISAPSTFSLDTGDSPSSYGSGLDTAFEPNYGISSFDPPKYNLGVDIDGLSSSYESDIPTVTPKPKEDDSSFFGDLSKSLLSPEGVTGLIGIGASYFGNKSKADLAEKQLAQQTEAEKFKALLDFEKLKYQLGTKASSSGSRSGGGSGSAAANRATLISALASAKNGGSEALGNLSKNLGTIYGR